jgi:hypothetical protein
MYAKPYDRKFGIEFEFQMPISPVMDDYGYENKNLAVKNLLSDCGFGDWSVGHDGSEFEVRTPILQGSHGFKQVKNFLGLILDHGANVTNADGLHVHHDAPEFKGNKPLVMRLVENWYENQNEIMKLAHSRRRNGSPCPAWNQFDLTQLNNMNEDGDFYYGRKNLNISSLRRHGTIEVRLHEGTLDYEEVFSWVRFGQAFIARAVNDTPKMSRADSPNDLLKRVRISRNASRFITKKVVNNYGGVMA